MNHADLLIDFISGHVPLSEEEKQVIRGVDFSKSVKKGEVLLQAGQKSKVGYFVLKGCLRTYYIIEGEEKTTEFYTEIEGITPECAFSGEPSKYYISAVEDTIMTVGEVDSSEDIFEKFPVFDKFCRAYSDKLLAKSQTEFSAFKTSSPETRYLNLLETRPDLLQRAPQHQISSYLGITPQSLSRLRARLAQK